MTEPNHYRVLGIASEASDREVRAAYARLVKRHHPDTHGALPHRLPEIQQAYRCLSDPALRAAHDRRLVDAERAHHEHQRRLHRRLDRYDRRHPLPPQDPVWRRWRLIAIVLAISLGAIWLGEEWIGTEWRDGARFDWTF